MSDVIAKSLHDATKLTVNMDAPDVPKPLTSKIKPSLTEEEVSVGLSEKTNGGKQFRDNYDLAKAALERADANELFVLYEHAVRERTKMTQAMMYISDHLGGDKDKPRFQAPENDRSIEAMKDVALAAIALARSVAGVAEDK